MWLRWRRVGGCGWTWPSVRKCRVKVKWRSMGSLDGTTGRVGRFCPVIDHRRGREARQGQLRDDRRTGGGPARAVPLPGMLTSETVGRRVKVNWRSGGNLAVLPGRQKSRVRVRRWWMADVVAGSGIRTVHRVLARGATCCGARDWRYRSLSQPLSPVDAGSSVSKSSPASARRMRSSSPSRPATASIRATSAAAVR